MKARALFAGIALFAAAAAMAPAGADAAWMMIAEDQHAAEAKCPEGFELLSIEAGDADLLVCAPVSSLPSAPDPEPAQASGEDTVPLEGPKFN